MNINQPELADTLVLTTSDSKIISYATFVAQPYTGAYNLINEKTIYLPVFNFL